MEYFKRHLLFTFDYELFLGKNSGTVEECLLKPTERLIKILDNFNYKGIFFIDTVYLFRINELSEFNATVKKDFLLISEQIKRISDNGHEIFIHLHPHWLDAVYNVITNTWTLENISKYRIASISSEQSEKLFEKSISLLSNLTNRSKYSFNGYRAGGWSIQPFEDFKYNFIKNNIKYEFSVIPGQKFISTAHKYDFTNFPKKKVYRFEEDICFEDPKGIFVEFTISSIYLNRMESYLFQKYESIKYLLKFLNKKNNSLPTTVNSKLNEYYDEVELNYNKKRIIASFERINIYFIIKYLIAIDKNNYFQFISHPKLLKKKDLFLTYLLLKLISVFKNIESDFKKINV